ncbi:MAG: NAD(P)-dependent oxidoreductase [Anaerovoracaceae bacterium]
MKICLIDAGIFIDKEELLTPLEIMGKVQVFQGIPETIDEVVARAKDAEIIAFGLMQFTNEMLDKLPNLKILQFIGTGVRNFVDVDYAASKGIKVLNIEGYGSNAVAEFAVSMGLAISKKICQADKILKTNRWTIDDLMGKEIVGSTVGVIGTGSIGKLVAEKYIALGANVIACDIYENADLKEKYGVKYKTINDIFNESDIVTLHMKVTEDNEKIIDKKCFSLMKKNAILVNVARAELVNMEDLYKALIANEIGGAAIDVYGQEPPSTKDYLLAQLDNVVATPHIAYYTQEANDNSIKMMVASILAASYKS